MALAVLDAYNQTFGFLVVGYGHLAVRCKYYFTCISLSLLLSILLGRSSLGIGLSSLGHGACQNAVHALASLLGFFLGFQTSLFQFVLLSLFFFFLSFLLVTFLVGLGLGIGGREDTVGFL